MSPRGVKGEPAPAATLIVGAITAVVSSLGLAYPVMLRELQRHPTPGAPAASWRLLTSLLVHDGWVPLALNLVGLVIVGAAVERRYGPARWLGLYLIGGLVGELVGRVWQPIGAGSSVASFGLVGGLVAVLLGPGSAAPGSPLPAFAAYYALAWVAAYTGLALGGIAGSVIAVVLCAPLGGVIVRSHARGTTPRAMGVALGCGVLGLAVLLCARRDIHGPPLIAGAIAAMLLRRRSRSAS